MKISAVINTLNEEKNIKRAIESIKCMDEILVCDMHSSDKTAEVAKKLGAKVVFHKRVDYVEPARNFAISKASGEWIFILDADEEVPASLAEKILEIVKKDIRSDFVEIPRKNIIFSHLMKASGWWPDYQIRLFKKGAVTWDDKIHEKPKTQGIKLTLPAEEKWALIHHNYQTISQFIDRMNRYTTIEAEQLKKGGYEFNWKDLIDKPLSEFLTRFFGSKGCEDNLVGLVLSLLQAFSFLIVYLKVWEMSRFRQEEINLKELKIEKDKAGEALNYWFKGFKNSGNFFQKVFKKFKT